MVTNWPLVGRAEELDYAVERMRIGGIVITGAAGVGKTHLARAIALRLGDEFSVVWTAATPGASAIPFGAMSHLLPELDPVGIDDRLGLLRRISDGLVERANGAVPVLAVDDAQWLDAGGAALVHQLAVSATARLLVTVRTGEEVPAPVRALWKDGFADRLELQPLSRLDLESLVVTAFDRRLDRPSIERLWALTEGNPFFVRELLSSDEKAFAESDGVWSWTHRAKGLDHLSAVLRTRLATVSSAGRGVLELLAVGEPLSLDLLALLCPTDAVAEVERVGLAVVAENDEMALIHPLYAEVIRSELTAVDRRRALARLAAAAESLGGASAVVPPADVLRVACWYLGSGTVEPARPMFTEAAEVANSLHDYPVGERLARRALRSGESVRASLVLGTSLNRQGRSDEALAVFEPLVDQAVSDQQRVEIAVGRSYGLTTLHGFQPEIAAMLSSAEDTVGDRELRAFLTAQRATILCFGGRLDEGIALATSVASDYSSEGTQLRVVSPLGGAWVMAGRAEAACDLCARMVEPAVRLQSQLPQALVWVFSTYVSALIGAGRLDDADALVTRVEASTPQKASVVVNYLFAFARGMSALQRGQAATAERWLRESIAGMRAAVPWRLAFGLSSLAEALALVGDADGARLASAEAEQFVSRAPIFEGLVRRAHGWAALASGRRQEAVVLLVDAARWSSAAGQLNAALFSLHDALRIGTDAVAARSLIELAPHLDGRWAVCFGNHAAAVLADDHRSLERVASEFENIGALLLAAEAFAEASASYGRAGLVAHANRVETRARVLASLCEGARTPTLADLELPAALTAREREIVRMAADGLSSAVIAEQLFVSTRTVEGHLHRAYLKLGVNDRKSLNRLLSSLTIDT